MPTGTKVRIPGLWTYHGQRTAGKGKMTKAPGPSDRRLDVAAKIHVVDDESWTSNETVTRQQMQSAILKFGALSQSVMDMEVRMGGEIRVELAITGMLIDPVGNVSLDVDAKLFEGTTESTTDLDGEKQIRIYCPVNQVVNHFLRVNNDDEGGDYTEIALTITNSPV